MVLALAVAASVGASFRNLILILGVGSWLFYFRIVRGEVLAIREENYIDAANAIGASNPRILLRHLLPNVFPSIIVIVTLFVPRLIMFSAALSFLGLGLPVGAAAWGIMVAEGRAVILNVWWLSLLPGLAITAVVLAFNFFGDWLRDALDPKLRRA